MTEKEHETSLKITTILPMGYGNPDSSISYDKNIEQGKLCGDIDNTSQEFITNGSGVVSVHEHDDGCIDGRCAIHAYTTPAELESLKRIDATDKHENYSSKNHERAKVAGGGYITGLAIRLGAGVHGESTDEDIKQLGIHFAERNIFCGAHSGENINDEATDCGANDKFRTILKNGSVYKDRLSNTTKDLFGLIGVNFNNDVFDKVIKNWKNISDNDAYFGESTSKSRLKTILATQAALDETAGEEKAPAVTKHLKGKHNEAYIIVNFVEGKTFSQNALLDLLHQKYPGVPDEELPQAFVVDGWRVAELANAAVEDDKKDAGLYAGVMYQLATAATLTDGSLKMFVYTE